MLKRLLIFAVLIPLLTAAALALSFTFFLLQPVGPPQGVVITIPAGSSLSETARKLEEEGVIAHAGKFRLLARLRGETRRTQAGEYEFGDLARPGAVLDRLVSGDVRLLRFSVPEGLTLREIAGRLETEGFGPAEAFLRLGSDAGFIASFGLEAASLEGYLFPETYTFVSGLSPERMLRIMVQQFRERLSPDLLEAAAMLGLTPHQLVTLASIIQKEAGNIEEMPLISAVFHNRLRKKMPLQADPTVIYGIEAFDGNLTRAHLRQPTPYNTYTIPGLPPGPIANPGLDALRAAAFPAEADFIYFVSRGNGTHVFSRTLQEHNQAVRQFQLRRRR